MSSVLLGGQRFDSGYYCNLPQSGTGSLEFNLNRSYGLLTARIGFADDSRATGQAVRFEFVGDGRTNLVEPKTLRFGEAQNIAVDVTGILRLTIRVTDTSVGGSSDSPSRPVFATPALISPPVPQVENLGVTPQAPAPPGPNQVVIASGDIDDSGTCHVKVFHADEPILGLGSGTYRLVRVTGTPDQIANQVTSVQQAAVAANAGVPCPIV